MQEFSIHTNLQVDLRVCYGGEEACASGHKFGPFVREEYLIHYILKGKGRFMVNDATYELGPKQGFLIYPGQLTTYEADEREPWHYVWIGFKGGQAKQLLLQANLTEANPIFTYQRDEALTEIHSKLLQIDLFDLGKDSLILGFLYQWLGNLISANGKAVRMLESRTHDLYFKEAIHYIHQNYYRPIGVASIANYLGIDRSYLFQIFKKQSLLSPSDYLIDFRLTKACELLKKTDVSIGNIAQSVGYQDPLTFSKVFKKRYKVSPMNYRKQADMISIKDDK